MSSLVSSPTSHPLLLLLFVVSSRVDVSGVLSPVQLSDQAVDLNLRLMRWRAAPGLDVNTLAQTKCLLLGERQR